MSKILIPLDGSELAESVIPCARVLAARWQARVHLLRVVEPFPVGVGLRAESLQRQTEQACCRYLEEVSRGLAGLEVTSESRTAANVSEEIIASARARGSDLIIMASHGRRGLWRWMMGSVAELVMRRAPCPVLLIQSPSLGEFRKVLVPVDGSAASLEVPQRLAPYLTAEAEVTLLRCSGLEGENRNHPAVSKYLERLQQDLEDIHVAGLNLQLRILEGEAPQGILEWAERVDCDLIAMSTQRCDGFRPRWHTGVTEEVVRQSRCPVLIFPPQC